MLSAGLVGALHVGLVASSLLWPRTTDGISPPPAGGIIPVAYLASTASSPPQDKVEPPPAPPQPAPEPEPVPTPKTVEPDPLPEMPVIESPLAQFEAQPEPIEQFDEDIQDEAQKSEDAEKSEPETDNAEDTSDVQNDQASHSGDQSADLNQPSTSSPEPRALANPASEVEGPAGAPGGRVGDAKDAWHASVVRQLEEEKDYPFMSRRQKEEGVILIAISIDRQGHITSTTLLQASAHDRLNEEAIDLMDRVGALPAPPPELTGEVFHLVVPIEFFLNG